MIMVTSKPLRISVAVRSAVFAILIAAATARAETSAFTFQGRLDDNGAPTSGNYDLELKLFTSATVGQGTQIGATLTKASVPVKSGVFTVELDFGANAFPGADRFLQVAVKPAASADALIVLTPRQPITPTPYALHSASAITADSATNASHATNATNATNATDASHAKNADNAANATIAANANNAATATNATQLGGQPASNYVQTNDGRLTDARPPTAGSANYIQNNATKTPQLGNFKISGDGDAFGTLSGNFVDAGTQFSIAGNRVLSVSGSPSLPGSNTFVGVLAGDTNTTGETNTFVGSLAGEFNTSGSNNTMLGSGADVNMTDLTNATAIGSRALVNQSNSLVLGSINTVHGATADTKVGIGTTAPLAPLDVRGNVFVGLPSDPSSPGANALFLANDGGDPHNSFRIDAANNNLFIIGHSNPGAAAGAGIIFKTAVAQGGEADTMSIEANGHVKFPLLGAGDTTTALCRNSLGEIAFCGSSSLRYKSEVATFLGGLEIINRLRPISFLWNQSGAKDIGFGAEEVEKVAPLFTFKNDRGEIEGVRYDRLGVLFVNAFKEQETQIEEQRSQIESLKKLVCLEHPEAEICRK
jgi:hypothetical protein